MNTPHTSPAGHGTAPDPRLGRTWVLPRDATCAGAARSLLSDTLTAAGMGTERVREAELIVSELATNAYEHARGHPPHELWLYPLHAGELICAVFDARHGLPLPAPGPALDTAPGRREPGDGVVFDAVRCDFGRGLTLVAGLANGRWGMHLSRSRSVPSVPGKVVWFGVPWAPAGASPGAPAGGDAAARTAAAEVEPAQAALALKELLTRRGITPVYLSERDRLWVVAIPYGLTVWIRDGRFELPGFPAGGGEPLAALPAVLEHLVRRYEQHRLADP